MPTATSPTPPPAPAPAPAPQPQGPPPVVRFAYECSAQPGTEVGAAAYLWQLMPAESFVQPSELLSPTGQDFAVAMKVARSRAGVGTSGQAQAILEDPRDGAFYVSGLAHAMTQQAADGSSQVAAVPPFIDGPDFRSVMSKVSVQRIDPTVQAVVGTESWVDLRSSASGMPQPFV